MRRPNTRLMARRGRDWHSVEGMKTSTKATLVGIVVAIAGFVLAWLLIEWMLEALIFLLKAVVALLVAAVLGVAGYIQFTRSRSRE